MIWCPCQRETLVKPEDFWVRCDRCLSRQHGFCAGFAKPSSRPFFYACQWCLHQSLQQHERRHNETKPATYEDEDTAMQMDDHGEQNTLGDGENRRCREANLVVESESRPHFMWCICGDSAEIVSTQSVYGGIIIECSGCCAWQHGWCVGYSHVAQVPQKYECPFCCTPLTMPCPPLPLHKLVDTLYEMIRKHVRYPRK